MVAVAIAFAQRQVCVTVIVYFRPQKLSLTCACIGDIALALVTGTDDLVLSYHGADCKQERVLRATEYKDLTLSSQVQALGQIGGVEHSFASTRRLRRRQ